MFCDLSTPSERWNAYHELRDLLAGRGVPREQVRFIHEARNDREKARLFAACRAGHVAVIVGSTEKMGVGTNIQDRCVAVHHLDCPWRPADIEQREGRGVRQGNQNPEIAIYRYAVEGSFDAYSWQTVERKARFINQVMRGRLDVREIEDIGENTLSFAEVKALASGDPLILEKASADANVTRLTRLERASQRNHQTLRNTIAAGTSQLDALSQQLQSVQSALTQRTDTRGERFHMTVDGRHVDARTDAAALIARWAASATPEQNMPVGTLGGLQIDGAIRISSGTHERRAELTLHALPSAPATLELSRLSDSPLSLIRQLEHRLEDLPHLADRLQRAPASDHRRARHRPRAAHPPVQIRPAARRCSRRSGADRAHNDITRNRRRARPTAPPRPGKAAVRAAFPEPPARNAPAPAASPVGAARPRSPSRPSTPARSR